ncbi:MAG: hypothetical protein JXR96_17330 [Deltaproteobacteria bacterium]|nr:hypothetical protein [Deltaproteobacteria bacterium]
MREMPRIPGLVLACMLCGLLAAACADGGEGTDAGRGDDADAGRAEDAGADGASDAGADGASDAGADGMSDAGADRMSDAGADGDAGQADGEDSLTPACREAGGVLCTEHTCVVCPAGTQPVASEDGPQLSLQCESLGWCCEPAPDTSCARSDTMTCRPWPYQEPPFMECGHCDAELACPEGRVCCSANCCGG